MPELPEVQTIADELRWQLLGRTFTDLIADWGPTLVAASLPEYRQRLVGQSIAQVARRGKYLVFSLSGSDTLLIHLKMSGHLSVRPGSDPPDRHTHVRFCLDSGQELRLRDVRKMGRVYLVADPQEVTGQLGPEPLAAEFTLPQFHALMAQHRGRLKPLLLNQRFLAGLGNIYTDEVLFDAGLNPLRTADTLTDQDMQSLLDSIRKVLTRALTQQGTTLGDTAYRRPDGRSGSYQHQLQIYGRKGQKCSRCGAPIERMVVAGRGTYLCPQCQV